MNEVRAIVEGFDVATGRGERCALATVVSVDGSSYRRPGARMLVCEGGSTIGTISAGCLESDVAEHASGVIRAGTPRLVVYDTSSASDEITWGLGLGCNGTVRVLVEPLSSTSLYVDALKRSLEVRAHSARVVVATVYECHASPETAVSQIELGSRLVIEEGVNIRYERLNEHSASILQREVEAALSGGMTSGARMHAEWGSRLSTFFETLMPPVRLVIFGAGHDALPVVAAARELGWHIEVVDPQARPVTLNRFGAADRVTLARPEEVGALGEITPGTMTLVMSHNYT